MHLPFFHDPSPALRYRRLAQWCVYALLVVVPLAFLPFTFEPLETNKQTLLVLLAFTGAIAWVGSMVAARVLMLHRGWLNAVILLLPVVTIISAVSSSSLYRSWIGTEGQEYQSVLTMFALAATFYLVANVLETRAEQRIGYAVMFTTGSIVGLLGIGSLLHLPVLPRLISGDQLGNTIGSLHAFGVYLATLAVLGSSLWIAHRDQDKNGWMLADRVGKFEHALIILQCLVAFAALYMIDDRPLWLTFLSGMLVMFALALLRAHEFHATHRFTLPFALALLAVPFLVWFSPLSQLQAPPVVVPSYTSSLDIARATLSSGSALFGTGPGTFSYAYAQYRPSELNATEYWDRTFDRASSFFLTVIPTLGVAGSIIWLLLIVTVAIRALIAVAREKGEWVGTFLSFPAWVTLVVGLSLYSGNLSLLFLLFVLSALLFAQTSGKPWYKTFSQRPKIAMLVSFLFIVMVAVVVMGMSVSAQRYVASMAFVRAAELDRAQAPLEEITKEMEESASLNRFDDAVYRNLANAYLRQLTDLSLQIHDAKDLTPERRQTISTLTTAAIDAATRATDLAPGSVRNWETRGEVYRALLPLIGNAGTFAVEAYQEAVKRAPNDVVAQTELGKTHVAIAEQQRSLLTVKDPEVKNAASKKIDEELTIAEKTLDEAIKLKSDYAPAHYQLALVYERQGRLDDAVGKMESVASYNALDVGVFFQLGLLYQRRGHKGDLERAQHAFEQAVALSPSYANARWFLASVYEQQGKRQEAIDQVKKVLEANPNDENVKARLKQLESGARETTIPQPTR